LRSVFQLIRNPENEDECVAVHIKCSNAPKGKSLAFIIGKRGGVRWTGFSELTADDLSLIVKRKEKGVPYENEPLVQVFNQLVTDRPGGGFWSYAEVKAQGMKILGFPPFSDTADLKARLEGSLTREMQRRDSLIVTFGHRRNTARGIRIEKYRHPTGYQTALSNLVTPILSNIAYMFRTLTYTSVTNVTYAPAKGDESDENITVYLLRTSSTTM